MKKKIIYACEQIDDEQGFELETLLAYMAEELISEIEVATLKRSIQGDSFFCKSVWAAMGKTLECWKCGKDCKDYVPRNGRAGCCIFWAHIYEPDKYFTLKIDGTLTPKI